MPDFLRVKIDTMNCYHLSEKTTQEMLICCIKETVVIKEIFCLMNRKVVTI